MIERKTLWECMKRFVYEGVKDIIVNQASYEQNNEATWDRVAACVKEYVCKLVTFGHLHEIKVVADSSVNTQETVEENEFHLLFCWKVDKDDEWTVTAFDVMPNAGMMISEESEGMM